MKSKISFDKKRLKSNTRYMKTMTCNQLGGACDKTFTAATFDEMVELSKQHGMEMFQSQDEAHLAVMGKIKMGRLYHHQNPNYYML